MNLLHMTPAEFCRVTNACEKGRDFALQHASMADVWDKCPRADWLIWIARALGERPDDRTLRLFAVWSARHTPLGDGRVTGDLLTDPRLQAALEVAERYAHGQATTEELAAARAAAWVAADAARAAAGAAAWDAAGAAADAAWAAAAAAAAATAFEDPEHAARRAWDAAGAAADAAWAAAAAAAAATAAADAAAAATAAADAAWAAAAVAAAATAAARAAAGAAQADQLRRMVPNPFRP